MDNIEILVLSTVKRWITKFYCTQNDNWYPEKGKKIKHMHKKVIMDSETVSPLTRKDVNKMIHKT